MKTIFTEFCSRILGKNGDYIPSMAQIQAVFCEGLFADFYSDKKWPKLNTVEKYCKGTAELPKKIRRHYAQDDGYIRIYANVSILVNAYVSIEFLQERCDELHRWVTGSGIPKEDLDELSTHYGTEIETRDKMTAYLADVLYYAIEWE